MRQQNVRKHKKTVINTPVKREGGCRNPWCANIGARSILII